jgi:1,2-diacylglycerol 3-beta-galactosyltransferase
MIFHSRVPGQEDGNVEFVAASGAGIWAPTPKKVVDTLTQWSRDPSRLAAVASICRKIAEPGAARKIAHLLGGILFNN